MWGRGRGAEGDNEQEKWNVRGSAGQEWKKETNLEPDVSRGSEEAATICHYSADYDPSSAQTPIPGIHLPLLADGGGDGL